MRQLCALGGFLVASWAAHAQAEDKPLTPGQYSYSGSGDLSIEPAKAGAQPFKIQVTGGNAHSCELEGEIKSGTATLEGADGACIVKLSVKPEGIDVSTSTPDPCRMYCGARAWFEGLYLRVPEACVATKVDADRQKFKKLFDAKDYAGARDILVPMLGSCEKILDRFAQMWIRNDLALTLHKLHDEPGCKKALEPLREWAEQSDDDIGGIEPAFTDELLKAARATRFNLKLCSKK